MERKENLKAEIIEKLEKLKEEVKKTGEKTADEWGKTMEEIGKDWEYLSKDFAQFFRETIEKPQVKDAISKTKSWLSSVLKSTADTLLKLRNELEEIYEADEEAPEGVYECIRCGATYEHKGGKLLHCSKCGGTTFKKIK